MNKQTKDQHQAPPQTLPLPPLEQANQQRQKAEAEEVAGRHKNDGQKNHKGAQ